MSCCSTATSASAGIPSGARRCRSLLRTDGTVLAEVEAPPTTTRTCLARLERGSESSAWFPWAVVGADAVDDLAARAGLAVRTLAERVEGRWFAELVVPAAVAAA